MFFERRLEPLLDVAALDTDSEADAACVVHEALADDRLDVGKLDQAVLLTR